MKKKITRIYHHYEKWEDYLNGMYDYEKSDNDRHLIDRARELLCDIKLFEKTMKEVLENWPISVSQNLTNVGANRRSWLGQASCSYKHKVPEILTRQAWAEMSELERFEANTIAEKIISQFENGR